jgi:energy-converting hydrogenase Eha subunit A
MPIILALVACGLLCCLAIFQLLLLAGAPFGRFVWGGESDVLPSRLRSRSVAAVVVYVIFVTVILQAVGIVTVMDNLVGQVAIYLVAACFFAGFIVSAMSRSPSERALMTPTSLVLSALCLIVAVTGHLVR